MTNYEIMILPWPDNIITRMKKLGYIEDDDKTYSDYRIWSAMACLTHPEIKVLANRYMSHRTQRRVTEIIGLSISRVQQLEKIGLEKLGKILNRKKR